jgi:small subunit ribosomal protein S4e
MVKNHLKRLNAPRTWKIKRKGIKFIVKPNPGPHSMSEGVPLTVIIRDILGYAKTTREVKRILSENNVLIDGIRRKDHRFVTGFMDTITFTETKEYFRVVINKKGNIILIKIDEKDASIKPCKIIGKTKIKGKTQLNLFDGKNILVEKEEYKTGDSLVLAVPKQEIKSYLKLDKGSLVYLTSGSHIGEIGTIEGIMGNKIKYKTPKGDVFETLKKYAFVIGKDKSIIKLE